MRYQIATLAIALTLSATTVARADGGNENDEAPRRSESKVQLGPRPFFAMSSHSRSASTTVLYWVQHEPAYGRQAVFLDDANVVADLPTFSDLMEYRKKGIRIWAPPTFALLALDGSNRIVASQFARDAKEAGLDIITWTLEGSGILADGNNGFYYQTIDQAIKRDGDLYKLLDVLRKTWASLACFQTGPRPSPSTPTAWA